MKLWRECSTIVGGGDENIEDNQMKNNRQNSLKYFK
jgi:hypothetical protein